MEDHLQILIKVAEAIAMANGSTCETVVHDKDLKIVYIANGELSGRSVGHVMDESVFRYLFDWSKRSNGIVIRLTRKENGELAKATTVFSYDSEGNYAGMLCFTQDLSAINQARNLLDSIMNTQPFDTIGENTNITITDYAHMVIADIIKEVGKPSTLGTKEINFRILRKLEEKGVFALKDAVPQVCEMLNISQATLYNYLREIRVHSSLRPLAKIR